MKKVLFLSLALILILGITSHGTSSYFSDTETSTGNTFTAWVEVCEPGSMIIVSDTDTMVTWVNGASITPRNAVYAWEHSNWANIDHTFSDGAQWIWETYRTDEPGGDAPIDGRVVRFERTFEIPCSPAGATLHITVDNGYTVWINGYLVGCAQVDADGSGPCSDGDPCACIGWETSDLTEDYVNSHDWTTVEVYTIPSAYLIDGTNVLVILAANEYMGPLDDQSNGTWNSNPAGLIYWLEVTWGD
jgi:predicted ribosomally synthesized peptide with SipW-like signal peptide